MVLTFNSTIMQCTTGRETDAVLAVGKRFSDDYKNHIDVNVNMFEWFNCFFLNSNCDL